MIGTLDGARAAGATGTHAEVTAALVAATLRVEAYCRDVFDPRTETRTLLVTDGLALAPVRLRAVTAVASGGTTLPAEAWRTIDQDGAVSTDPNLLGVEMAVSGANGLISGAEPWRGGWANLWDTASSTVTVTGSWGWAVPPDDAIRAVHLIAAMLAPAPYTPAADAEGNALGLPDSQAVDPRPEPVTPASRVEHTTGSATADRLLLPYRRAVVRMT